MSATRSAQQRQNGTRRTATIEGVQIVLTGREWALIANMVVKRAGVECAPPATAMIQRLAAKRFLQRESVIGASAQVYVCAPLATAFYAAISARTAKVRESAAVRASRRLAARPG